MHRTTTGLLAGMLVAACASWVGLRAAPDEPPKKGDQPAAPALGALEKPLHWSAQPAGLAEGFTITQSWFIRFETPTGETIPARIFLIERRAHPARILCLGHEIETTEGFTPDYHVARVYVRPMGEAMYRVSLGNVEALVRTSRP